MNLSTLFASATLLSVFAIGCAVDPSAAHSESDEAQTDEAADELTRAGVKGIYVRSAHVASCNVASTLELLANGSFKAKLDYVGPNVRCARPATTSLSGVYTVNSTSKITFKAAGSTATFSLRLASGSLSGVAGSSAYRSNFEGSFRKLGAGECVNDASCGRGQTCEAPLYTMDTPFVAPAVYTGFCQAAPPSGPKCGGFAGLVCPQDTYCDESTRDPRIADQMFDCKPIIFSCTMQYAPVCGKDGVTYGNACLAGVAKATIAHQGKCLAAPPRP